MLGYNFRRLLGGELGEENVNKLLLVSLRLLGYDIMPLLKKNNNYLFMYTFEYLHLTSSFITF
jgi:hypothetical protein